MSAHLYVEGGGSGADSKELQARCREGFRKLLENAGLKGRMPRLTACGGRAAAFDDFKTAHAAKAPADFVAMLIDSEDPVKNIDATWTHVKKRDSWARPDGAVDGQILFMTTCMETWIVGDQRALQDHYGANLQLSALPSTELEARNRHDIQDCLVHATRNCDCPYKKGKRSFAILAKLHPHELGGLPSFVRTIRACSISRSYCTLRNHPQTPLRGYR